MRATPWRGAQWGEFRKTGSRHTPEPEYRPVQEVTSHAAPVVGIGGLVEGALIALEPAMRELAPWLPERLQGVAIMSAVIHRLLGRDLAADAPAECGGKLTMSPVPTTT